MSVRTIKIIVTYAEVDSITNYPGNRCLISEEAAPFHVNVMVPSWLLSFLLLGVWHL